MPNIPIMRSSDDETVGRVVWKGTFRNLTWRYVAKRGFSEEKKRFRNAVQSGRWMEDHNFDVPGFPAKGWKTFWGLIEALRNALPPFGLEVDEPNTDWPEFPKSFGDDIKD